jgi:hypothetical protein
MIGRRYDPTVLLNTDLNLTKLPMSTNYMSEART